MKRKKQGRKKKKTGKSIEGKIVRGIGKSLLFLLKTPYYLGKGIYKIFKKTGKIVDARKIRKSRESVKSLYEDFKVIKSKEGEYNNWVEKLHSSDSQIGVILGARGSGKTAFGIKMLENAHAKYKKKCFAIGFKKDEMPLWINVVENISELGNNSFVLVDEGGVLFSSRDAMSNANKLLSDLILIARHKNLTIVFISQNSSNIEVNVLRQADFLVLKPSSLLQNEFERKIVQKIYSDVKSDFDKFKDEIGLAYIYAGNFRGFVSNSLPSFWKENISKSFR